MSWTRIAPALAGQVIGSVTDAFVIAEWRDPGGAPGPPRLMAPPHLHRNDDEAWYVLESTLRVRVGKEEVEAHAGSAVFVPRGTPHTYWNPSPAPTRYLLVMTANIYRLIQEIHGMKERTPAALRAVFAKPVIYKPFAQSPQRSMTLLLRATSNPTSCASAVRDVVQQVDSGIALRGVNTLEEEVADSIAIVRIMGILMGIFGLLALALSSIGVYGVLSESVAQRTHEIGIRLALGANPRDLMSLILAQALKLTGIGLAIAVPCAVAISRAMASLIFGVVSLDFSILGGFTALLLFVALGAGYLPARRAIGVDPVVSLRYE